MNNKDVAENIDRVLKEIHTAPRQQISSKALLSIFEYSHEELALLLHELESHHLIEQEDNLYFLTEKGFETVENGGIAYLQEENRKQEAIPDFRLKIMQQLEDMMADQPNRKENFKKIKRITFAWLFGLALAGMFLAYLTSK